LSVSSFAFGLITKTITTLKNLESIDINLGIFDQSPSEMPAYLQSIVKHPNLKKAIIALVVDEKPIESYEFDEDFYGDILLLLGKLQRFHITLANFPQDVENKITKLFKEAQKSAPRQYTYLIRDSQRPTIPYPLNENMKWIKNDPELFIN